MLYFCDILAFLAHDSDTGMISMPLSMLFTMFFSMIFKLFTLLAIPHIIFINTIIPMLHFFIVLQYSEIWYIHTFFCISLLLKFSV